MKVQQTIALRCYPPKMRLAVLTTYFEAQTRVNVAYLAAFPQTPPLYKSGVRYRREGTPEQWKDIPTILRDGFDDCEGLACWLAAELRVNRRIEAARVHLVSQAHDDADDGAVIHAIVVDGANPRRRWDPSKVLGMRPQPRRRKTSAA